MNKVRLNLEQCAAVGKILQKLRIKPSVYEREFITFQIDPETKLRAYLYCVGICHQTHTLINKKLNLVGFNYLERVFVDLSRAHTELLEPAFLAQQTPEGLAPKLASVFSEDNACTLDRLPERSQLLIDMGRKLHEGYSGQITELLSSSGGYMHEIYNLLDGFEAYSDPFRKKSSLFVTLASEAKLLEIKDRDNVVPIMDYHIQRVLMRLGCVEIVDQEFRQALINRETVDSDEETRAASIQAIKQIAHFSGHHSMTIHDFFWPLGRSCCKDKPLCKSGVCDKKPCTFHMYVELPSHEKCIFEGTCKGSLNDEYLNLWQPLVDTQYY